MLAQLQEEFISRLEAWYGPWERTTSKFGTSSFGKIAEDLCISPSQFSKLISGTATDGMYVRTLRNIDRLVQEDKLRQEKIELEGLYRQDQDRIRRLSGQRVRLGRRSILLLALFGIFILVIGYLVVGYRSKDSVLSALGLTAHPLSIFFDLGFDEPFSSPYLRDSEIQEYCPCSAYEGNWSLVAPYKLPLPGTRQAGLYYMGKSADVRMKCSKNETLSGHRGRILRAYEYLVNEIWIDTKQLPLSPRFFDKNTKTFTDEFEALEFAGDPQFRRVATIHSFFISRIEIHDDVIIRKGEPGGRFARDIDEKLVAAYGIDLKYLLRNILADLTTTECEPAVNAFCDPNRLQEGQSEINFDCLYTIKAENLGLGGGYPYTKGYRLDKQSYADNLTCACGDTIPPG
jgi:hypothetical protein